MVERDLCSLSVQELLDELASDAPAPAGGSAAAVAIAMAASLVEMGARRSPSWEDAIGVAAQARSIRARTVPLVQADAEAYAASLVALAGVDPGPGPGPGRDEAIASALGGAADVALSIARAGTDAAFLAELVADRGEPSGRDDAQAAAVLAEAGTRMAAALVAANLVTSDGDEREAAAATCARSAASVRERISG